MLRPLHNLIATSIALLALCGAAADEELGRFSANPFHPDSTGNPLGAGSPHRVNGINNPAGPYGSPDSNRSANNPYATDAPKLYDDAGNYRGRLSANPNDPDSIANPHGRYGSPHSPDSVNNPAGAGNPLRPDSPANPFGRGLRIVGATDEDQPPRAGETPKPADTAACEAGSAACTAGQPATGDQAD